MNKKSSDIYLCPVSLKPMQLVIDRAKGNNVIEGKFISENGNEYLIRNGIPDFTYPFELPASDASAKKWYDDNANVYDEYLPLTFMTFNENELEVRNKIIDILELEPDYKVLEVGAGTGRDSELIAQRLNGRGSFYLQDLSLAILEKSFEKMREYSVSCEFHIGNACYLPFPNNFFDAAFHFGGLNTFSEISRFMNEIARVTKIGGKILVGDENMPIWLRDTEFGRILMNSNPLYEYELPLKHLPVVARNVKVEWIIGGVFYIVSFIVGEGEPYANFGFEIPGPRGGTHRTRYYGQLEGVTPKTKELARKASGKSGKSMHKWLDDMIKEAARTELFSK